MKVLCVDHSPLIRRQIAEMLAEVQEVELLLFATNSADALRLAINESPALMILDVQLPKGSGLQLLETIRRIHLGIRTIVFTNDEFEQTRQRCLAIGVDAYLHKSWDFNMLTDVVRKFCGV